MPAPMPPEPPPGPDENALAAETDGEAFPDPMPLQTSPAALRVDGDAACAPDFFATELANTAWPRWLVTPAVAP